MQIARPSGTRPQFLWLALLLGLAGLYAGVSGYLAAASFSVSNPDPSGSWDGMARWALALIAIATVATFWAGWRLYHRNRTPVIPDAAGLEFTITTVDYAPADLDSQVPFSVHIDRLLPGPDRPDYWLGSLRHPLAWKKDGTDRQVKHIVLGARWVGTALMAGATHLPVGIAYVVDEALLAAPTLDFAKCEYVAIGLASDTTGGRPIPARDGIMAGNIARSFGTGTQS